MTGFLREWIRAPRLIGAVAPSSRRLADAITREITPATGSVIEFGPGTGVFTRAILGAGIPEYGLVLVEQCDRFAETLATEYRMARVIHGDAGRVVLPAGAGAVVSGLPLRNMNEIDRLCVVGNALSALRPGGSLYQFTYGRRFPLDVKMLEVFGVEVVKVATVWGNLPPATVWKVTQTSK